MHGTAHLLLYTGNFKYILSRFHELREWSVHDDIAMVPMAMYRYVITEYNYTTNSGIIQQSCALCVEYLPGVLCIHHIWRARTFYSDINWNRKKQDNVLQEPVL